MLKPVNSFVSKLGAIGEMVAENPLVLFFVIHTLLLVIYLPLGLKPIHKFNLLQQIAVAVPTGCLILAHGIAGVGCGKGKNGSTPIFFWGGAQGHPQVRQGRLGGAGARDTGMRRRGRARRRFDGQ